jgi:hypothetical protein
MGMIRTLTKLMFRPVFLSGGFLSVSNMLWGNLTYMFASSKVLSTVTEFGKHEYRVHITKKQLLMSLDYS